MAVLDFDHVHGNLQNQGQCAHDDVGRLLEDVDGSFAARRHAGQHRSRESHTGLANCWNAMASQVSFA